MVTTAVLESASIETITAEILILKKQTAQNIIEIGRRLIKAKKLVGHGNWLPYLRANVQLSEVWAQKFMRVAREYQSHEELQGLNPSHIMLLLEVHPEDRSQLAEMAKRYSSRDLAAAVRKANQKRRETAETIESSRQMARDLDCLRARERELTRTIDQAQANMAEAKRKEIVAARERVLLERQLEQADTRARMLSGDNQDPSPRVIDANLALRGLDMELAAATGLLEVLTEVEIAEGVNDQLARSVQLRCETLLQKLTSRLTVGV